MAAVGGAVTLSALGVMVWEACQPSAPPAMSARIVRTEATASGYVGTLLVANGGDRAAAAVTVEARLDDETATATLDYVPGHGEAKAFVRFDADPRLARVKVQAWSAP
ncbi:hypothetical protein GVN18_19660 [Pseudomonas sp. ODNR1LW]|nr:hypothetical protein [Pseudomonas sp. ODNR1LW]